MTGNKIKFFFAFIFKKLVLPLGGIEQQLICGISYKLADYIAQTMIFVIFLDRNLLLV